MNIITRWFKKIRTFALAHKVIASLIAIVVVWGGWHIVGVLHGNSQPSRYVVGTAQKGTLVIAVTGSGQVSASNQVDVKPKVSGEVTAVRVVQGQAVKKGAVLVQLDATDAQKAVRDAQNSLQSEQLSLQKLQINQRSDIPKLQTEVTTAQQSAYNAISNTFLDLPDVADHIHGVLNDDTLHGSCSPNFCQYQNLVSASNSHEFAVTLNQANNDEASAQAAYTTTLNHFKVTPQSAGSDKISSLLDETIDTVQLIAQAVKSEQTMLASVVNDMHQQSATFTIPSQITAYQSTINGDTSTTTSRLSSLQSAQNSITSAQQALDAAKDSNPIDLATEQNSLQQRQAALIDAQQTLAESSVRAPFDGIIAKVSVKLGDSASSGAAVATIITNQELATVTLNEVDVAKVSVGQPVTLTFDAVPDLTIAGQVATVDTLGTVSQGVVTYSVTMSFATQDPRIKSGMSASAAIATQVKTDVLLVPSSAVKTQGGQSYVLVVDGALPPEAATPQGFTPIVAPRQVVVQTGLSDDTQTEIISGLAEGDQIVTRTITTTAATASSAPSLLNAAGVRSGAAAGAAGGFRGAGAGR